MRWEDNMYRVYYDGILYKDNIPAGSVFNRAKYAKKIAKECREKHGTATIKEVLEDQTERFVSSI